MVTMLLITSPVAATPAEWMWWSPYALSALVPVNVKFSTFAPNVYQFIEVTTTSVPSATFSTTVSAAQELTTDLRVMAANCVFPLQLMPPGAHEQLLERLRLSGLYAEVNAFSCTQWQLLSDGLIGNGADGVFMADEEIRPDCQVATLAR